MVKNDPIYVIVLFEELKELEGRNGEKLGVPDTSNFNDMGFYYDPDEALAAMHENRLDIRETVFNYGFILKHYPGLYNNSSLRKERVFFKWDEEKQGFYEAEEPDFFKTIGL